MSTWKNLSGQEVEVNDTEGSIAAATKAGWTRKQTKKKAKKSE